jgi:aspartate-semialdehyde dehydrogenase
MPAPSPSPCRVAIVGASTLRGKELKQVLEDRNFPAVDFILLDESVAVGTLTEAGGEPTFIRAIEEDEFERAQVTFFAGSPAEAAKHWRVAQRVGSRIIDLTGALAEVPEAMPRIPSLAKLLPPAAAPSGAKLICAPSTPVIIACTLAAALASFHPARLVIVFFPPVSEHDQAGVDELESQAASLLSFREIAQPVFDAQVAFNLLTGYGAGSQVKLEDVRAAVARDVARCLAGRIPAPAIQLVQAPVFYGYAFAVYFDLPAPRPAGEVEQALAAVGIKMAAAGEPPPTNVSVAGESSIAVRRVERDAGVETGYWLWGAADNFRLAATNAVSIAEELLV